MVNCGIYASIYIKNLNLLSLDTTKILYDRLKIALSRFYASFIVFPIKAVNYFSQNTSYPFEFDTYATKFQRYIDEIDNSEKGSRTLADMVIETV